jgi:hypothetical protein
MGADRVDVDGAAEHPHKMILDPKKAEIALREGRAHTDDPAGSCEAIR